MRTLLMFLLLSAPLAGHAMDSSDCPNNVQVGYEDLIPVSEKKVERLHHNSNPQVYRTAVKAREALIRTSPDKVQDLGFKFKDGAGSICSYSRSQGGEGKLEVFTKQGNKFLRVFLPFRDFDLYTVHALSRVSTRGLKDDYRPTTPLFVKVGDQSYQVGWAYSLTLGN